MTDALIILVAFALYVLCACAAGLILTRVPEWWDHLARRRKDHR